MMWTVPGYHDVRELGRGASGRVVLSTHDGSGTPVAIKYLAGDEEFRRDFRAEARLLAEVTSPHVAALYEYVEAGDGAAIVMELVDGVNLRVLLREHGAITPESALCVLKGSLLGLAAAHEHGVVHRDYKPGNVLVGVDGESKLADFGVAARAGRATAVAGTPAYMAPEQWAGAAASPATDIYAATATFVECLTGRAPYQYAGDLTALRRQHENAPIPVERVPEPVRDLVRRGLAKDPSARPAGARRFVADLEAAARLGYGEDWERRGRGALVQRVALLALLLPWAAGVAGGSALAVTALGAGLAGAGPVEAGPPGAGPVDADPPETDPVEADPVDAGPGSGPAGGPDRLFGAPRAWIVTATAGVALAATATMCALPRLSGPPAPVSAPVAVTVVTPDATASASASPSASPAPRPSVAPVTATRTSAPPPPPAPPAPPRTTSRPPPPPALTITSISVTSFAYTGDGNNVRATVSVQASTTGAFTLTVRFVGIGDQGQEVTSPAVRTFQRSGQTSYTVQATIDAGQWCDVQPSVRVTASAKGKTSSPQFAGPPFC